MKKNTIFLALIIVGLSLVSCEQEPCTRMIGDMEIEVPCDNFNDPFPFNN